MIPESLEKKLGIRANLSQFLHQLLQVFFVGLMIGMQRTVVPILAHTEFGVPEGSFTILMSFIISFGFVKGLMNFVAGRLSERLGRKKILLLGWIFALPIPFMILFAQSWEWIVLANIFLGINQGFAWSMTVTSKVDITRPTERGLATGFNEFAGYGGVALAGILTGYLGSAFEPKISLSLFGLIVIVLALLHGFLSVRETLSWARAEARNLNSKKQKNENYFASGLAETPSTWEVFSFVTFRNKTFAALSQAGCIEKFVDALVWAFFPVYLFGKGLAIFEIGWVVGVYGLVWGFSQLWTGPLSDKIGRKGPIVAGMWLAGIGVAATLLVKTLPLWFLTAAITGVGMALLYPTLIAAIGDISHPNWRGSSLGVYRFWRDSGYAIGALLIGFFADFTGQIETGFWFTSVAMGVSGFWVLMAAKETNPKFHGRE